MTDKKQSTQHSPLPWEFVASDSKDIYAILDANGVYIAETLLLLPGDFQLIVEAVNSHEGMKRLAELITNHPNFLGAADRLYQLSIWREMEELARKFQEMDRE